MTDRQQIDAEMERDIQDLALTAPRVTPDQIETLMSGVRYEVQVVPGTTTTLATAIAANGFTLAIGMTACADPANFNAELGAKYAIKDAEAKARQELWKLEGWRLKFHLEKPVSAQLSVNACQSGLSHVDRMRQEHCELCDRLNKLDAFINTAKFNYLPVPEKARMKHQLVVMRDYVEVLGHRIACASTDKLA